MTETELKFQVAPAGRAALRQAVAGTGSNARTIRLQAHYYDTPEASLAAAGLALRLRREGRGRWVQALKGRGDGLLRRLEHEVVLGPGQPPALDLSRHDGTAAGEALRAALGARPGTLAERFATDIRRTHRLLRTRSPAGASAAIEVAFDEGWISAPGELGPRRLAVAELELELRTGPVHALLALASRWVGDHPLWLDVRSKAERGQGLASGVVPPATGAQAAQVAKRMAGGAALAAMLQASLAQVLPNVAVLAEGKQASPAHLHQLRVGLRRLRTALREFGAGVAGIDPAWDDDLAGHFARLGALRDREISLLTMAPALAAARAAGLAIVPVAGGSAPAPADRAEALLRGTAFNRLMLELIGLVLAREAGTDGPALDDTARQRLARLHRRVLADGADFATIDDAARHTLRKRVKRLRYSLEFVARLFRAKAVARYLALLRPLQDSLGEYNDVVVAAALCQSAARDNPSDAFVLGWLGARRDALASQAGQRLQAMAEAKRFWKRP